MADLDERFRSLSRTGSPDLWPDIEGREPGPMPAEPRVRRLVAAAMALLLAFAGLGLVAITFGGSESPMVTGTSGSPRSAISNGSIAFTSGAGGESSYHIAAVRPGGTVVDLIKPGGGGTDLAPQWSPDGGRIAFLRYTSGDYELVVANSDGSGVMRVGRPAEAFTWAPDGRAIAHASFQPGSDLDIMVIDVAGGRQRELVASQLTDTEPSWSPNGDAIAFVSYPVHDRDADDADIFVVRPDGTGVKPLTAGPAWDSSPMWSPDGRKIAYMSDRDGASQIFVMNADGSGSRRITDAPQGVNTFIWSPDGTQLAFGVYSGTSMDIYVVNADGTGQMAIADSPQDEVGPEWSPDGTLLAFASAESAESCQCDNSGSFDIYVMNPDGTGKIRLTHEAYELGGDLSRQPVSVATDTAVP
jgi:Tol biopolymer transport system component